MEALRGWLVPLLLPERCFDELFLRLHLLHVPCLKILLSKALGYAIVAGSVMVKLPQVLKVVGARSGSGLSIPAVLLELLALGGTVAYGCARAFPFSAWGEALFLLLQTLTIGFLIQHFGGHTGRGQHPHACVLFGVGGGAWTPGSPDCPPAMCVMSPPGLLFVAGYGVLLGALLSPYAPPGLATLLQAANLPIIILSRVRWGGCVWRGGGHTHRGPSGWVCGVALHVWVPGGFGDLDSWVPWRTWRGGCPGLLGVCPQPCPPLASAGGHQLPSGSHGAALRGLHHPPAGGGPGPRVHIPPGKPPLPPCTPTPPPQIPPPHPTLSPQETGDALLALTFVASAACNGLLLAQLLYYRGASVPHPKGD
uniref:Mannose-P-dolichol utilization defect 1 n=1 Tax=Accipiter nisus TaxID=211598 RepID=A0A8B9MFL7_9AVES